MKRSELKELIFNTFGHLDYFQLLGLTGYAEARGEPKEGIIAVMSVILERVDHRDWDGKTIREVCLMPYQFSCYLPDDDQFPALRLIAGNWEEKYLKSIDLKQCYRIAVDLINGLIPRQTEIEK